MAAEWHLCCPCVAALRAALWEATRVCDEEQLRERLRGNEHGRWSLWRGRWEATLAAAGREREAAPGPGGVEP